MLKTQAVNLPPWKIVTWFARLIKILQVIQADLEAVDAGGEPSEKKLPKLSKHWEELTPPTISDPDSESEVEDEDYGTFQVIIL